MIVHAFGFIKLLLQAVLLLNRMKSPRTGLAITWERVYNRTKKFQVFSNAGRKMRPVWEIRAKS
ncbi:MAG: hypothetical protein CW742_14610 [Methanoregula sp.]|nr:MAG: hypothetical protein CW742_14610 [Methanoregula sp.]